MVFTAVSTKQCRLATPTLLTMSIAMCSVAIAMLGTIWSMLYTIQRKHAYDLMLFINGNNKVQWQSNAAVFQQQVSQLSMQC